MWGVGLGSEGGTRRGAVSYGCAFLLLFSSASALDMVRAAGRRLRCLYAFSFISVLWDFHIIGLCAHLVWPLSVYFMSVFSTYSDIIMCTHGINHLHTTQYCSVFHIFLAYLVMI